MDAFLQDVRYAARTFRALKLNARSPAKAALEALK